MEPKVASNARGARIVSDPEIAFLSSEFALSDDLPIYAGGLGILAADVLYQAAEDHFPLCGITVFYREGFFQQKLDENGNQQAYYQKIDPAQAGLVDLDHLLEIPFPDRKVLLKIWRKEVHSSRFQSTTDIKLSYLYLLDADITENSPEDRKITDRLYERVWAPHIDDDLILGIGSVRLVRALKLPIKVWHINDDHSGFNILERLREYVGQGLTLSQARDKVKEETIFTTHTPVGGAESKFSKEEIFPIFAKLFEGLEVQQEELWELGKRKVDGGEEVFSLTVLAMRHARVVNAVSQKHFEVAKKLWGFIDDLPLTYVTNGVYPPRWNALELTGTDPVKGKLAAKTRVAEKLGFDPKALVLVWSRRFTEYKQPLIFLTDPDRLAKILTNPQKPVYLLMAGKAHPEDPQGQEFVKAVFSASRNPLFNQHLLYFPNYNLTLAHDLLAAADVWVNTPTLGWEASGTSGMKAVFNHALNASTLDGWWAEGFNPRVGWAIDPPTADSLYKLLEDEIVPTYFGSEANKASFAEGGASCDHSDKWQAMVKEALATCGQRFNTKRMLEEYKKLYQL